MGRKVISDNGLPQMVIQWEKSYFQTKDLVGSS